SAFRNGQTLVNINIYPFRMTEQNMQRHRNSDYLPFWKQLQPGYAYFNEHHQPPMVNVVNGQYVVNRPSALDGQSPSQLAFTQTK
ncbi:MAG: transpeptidase, partial [Hafnia sp.]